MSLGSFSPSSLIRYFSQPIFPPSLSLTEMTKSKNSRVVNWKSRRETDDSDSSSDEKHGMRLLGGGSLKACSDLHLQRRSCRCSGASRKLPECSCSGLAASGVLWSALERVPFHLRRQNVVTASIGRTLDWEAIPVWMRENEVRHIDCVELKQFTDVSRSQYITTGYRKYAITPSNSFLR